MKRLVLTATLVLVLLTVLVASASAANFTVDTIQADTPYWLNFTIQPPSGVNFTAFNVTLPGLWPVGYVKINLYNVCKWIKI